jgi:hypothetical protein
LVILPILLPLAGCSGNPPSDDPSVQSDEPMPPTVEIPDQSEAGSQDSEGGSQDSEEQGETPGN